MLWQPSFLDHPGRPAGAGLRSVAAVFVGRRGGTAGRHLPLQPDRRVRPQSPCERAAPGRRTVARGGVQPLRRRFPDLPALQIPHTGETLTFAELDARAESVAAALVPYVTAPDQVVAVAMSQDNWHIVAARTFGILKAGGGVMFLDTTLPDALIAHMLNDARPVVILTRGPERFRDLPTLDLLTLPERLPKRAPRRPRPAWLDDPTLRLAAIFYTSGTTGMPKGVECHHAGYVNLALSYADYFDLMPGMDATTLTSSLGYDGSMTEMYSAWVSGCAVVMLTKEQIRSGPDLVPVLRDAEVTVLFCPPVLLTTLTQSPEVDLPYPLCRYVVPAGEAFPSALVRALDPRAAADRQHLRPHRGEHRHQPPDAAAGGADHHRLALPQRDLRHPRGGWASPAAPRRDGGAVHRRGARRARLSQPARADRPEVHIPPAVRAPLSHRRQMQDRNRDAARALLRPHRRAAQGARTSRRGAGGRGHPADAVQRDRGRGSGLPE